MSVPLLNPAYSPAACVLHDRILNEPKHRISEAQREAMRQLARKDPRARLEGLDWKLRPVVKAHLAGPATNTCYALMKNGNATGVTWDNPRGQRLAEHWR